MKDESNKIPEPVIEDEERGADPEAAGSLGASPEAGDLAQFAASVGHAFAPGALSDDAHEEILARVLAGIERPAREVAFVGSTLVQSAEPPADRTEQRSAEQLRDALAAADFSHPLVALAQATRLASAPSVVPEIVNERHVRAALKAPSKVVFLRTATIFGVVAAAAAVLMIFVGGPKKVEAPSASVDPNAAMEFLPGMVESRTTTTLFEPEDFPRDGGERARIDRISNARKSDLRQNQFVAWGAE